MKTVLPITKKNGSEFTPEELVHFLNDEPAGTFVISNFDTWHGGIHISTRTADWCTTEPVRAVCDGEIVAYRMNQQYQTGSYTSNNTEHTLQYSNNFCLIKHTVQCKKDAPTTPDAATTPATPDAAPASSATETATTSEEKLDFVFYSLYMHLLPWDEYEKPTYMLKKSRNVRKDAPQPEGYYTAGTSSAILKKDEQIQLIDQSDVTTAVVQNENVKIASIVQGKSEYRLVKARIVSKGEASASETVVPIKQGNEIWIAINSEPASNYHTRNFKKVSPIKPCWMTKKIKAKTNGEGVIGRGDPLEGKVGEASTTIPSGTTFSYGPAKIELQRLGEANVEMVRATVNMLSSTGRPTTSMWLSPHAEHVEIVEINPYPLNLLKKLESPIKINAGDPVGHLGLCEIQGPDGLPKRNQQVHIEIFSTANNIPESFLKDISFSDDAPVSTFNAEEATGHYAEENSSKVLKKVLTENGIEHQETTAGLISDAKNFFRDVIAHHYAVKHRSEWAFKVGHGIFTWLAAEIEKYDQSKKTEELRSDGLYKAENIRRINDKLSSLNMEKERINNLEWMSPLEDIGSEEAIWHFYPILNQPPTLFTKELIQAVTNKKLTDTYLEKLIPLLNEFGKMYKVNTPLRVAHFAAQVGHESNFKPVTERGSYSASRLLVVFGRPSRYYDHTVIENSLSEFAHNAEKLFNFVYANRDGNGSVASGDGYRFRGRGLIQLTAKSKYQAFNHAHHENNPSSTYDFIANPELISTSLSCAVESALWFWDWRNINPAAERDNVYQVTRKINGGQIEIDARIKNLNSAKRILGI